MKHTIKGTSLLLSLVLVTLFTTLQSSSCSKNDDIQTTSNTGTPAGTWKVSLFWDAADETNHFTGYSFTFNSAGTITATKAGVSVTGNWTETSTKFAINFGTDPVLSELNNDWLKEVKNSSSIQLKDDNPARDEKLQFVMN